MAEFLAKVKNMLEMLAACGEKMEISDVMLIVLNALGPKYEPFITSVTTRMDATLTFVDLQSMLLDQELQLGVVNPKLGSINAATVDKGKESETHSDDDTKSGDKGKLGECQICTKQGHSTLKLLQ